MCGLAKFPRCEGDPRAKVDLDMISHCADRYRVSLIAAILRWLAYTERRAILVVSRDGFILWSRASDMALNGAFFHTSGGPSPHPLLNQTGHSNKPSPCITLRRPDHLGARRAANQPM
jgi:hypothetical protein